MHVFRDLLSRWLDLGLHLTRLEKSMAALASTSRFASQSRLRHQYQMIPSKDHNVRVINSSTGEPVDERYEMFDGAQGGRFSWRKQMIMDLKPSRHRDT